MTYIIENRSTKKLVIASPRLISSNIGLYMDQMGLLSTVRCGLIVVYSALRKNVSVTVASRRMKNGWNGREAGLIMTWSGSELNPRNRPGRVANYSTRSRE